MARPDRHHLEAPLVVLVDVDLRRGPRVVVHVPRVVQVLVVVHRQIVLVQRERRHLAPLRAQRVWVPADDDVPALVLEVLERQRLPAHRVDQIRVAREVGQQRGIDRLVHLVPELVLLVRAVREPVVDHAEADPVPDRRRAVADRALVPRVVAQVEHLLVDRRLDDVLPPRRQRVAGLDDAVHRVADRLVPRRLDVVDVVARVVLGEQERVRHRVVRRPRVVHRHRRVPQVPRVDRRTRDVVTDRLQDLLVPLPRHRLLRHRRRTRRQRQQRRARKMPDLSHVVSSLHPHTWATEWPTRSGTRTAGRSTKLLGCPLSASPNHQFFSRPRE